MGASPPFFFINLFYKNKKEKGPADSLLNGQG
jgi:hypothetical protein